MIQVEQSVTINRPRHYLYAYWRTFSQLPRFMRHLVSVSGDADGVSHWVAKAPIGTVEWDAKVVEDKPDEMISWRSLDDADIKNSGAVRFFDADNGGTKVVVNLTYHPPAGALGQIVAKLFGEEPDQQIHEDLLRLKQMMEEDSQTHQARDIRENEGDVDAITIDGATVATGGVGVENLTVGPGMGVGGAGAAATRGIDFERAHNDVVDSEDNFEERRGLKTGSDTDSHDPNDRDLIRRTM